MHIINYSQFVVRLYSDVNKIREGIGDKVANCLQWTAAFVSGLIIGIAYGWKLALVIIAVSPLLVICGGFMTYVSNFYHLFGCIHLFHFYRATLCVARSL